MQLLLLVGDYLSRLLRFLIFSHYGLLQVTNVIIEISKGLFMSALNHMERIVSVCNKLGLFVQVLVELVDH